MTEFKIGDVVEVIDVSGHVYKAVLGALHTVVRVENSGRVDGMVWVEEGWGMYAKRFKLHTPCPTETEKAISHLTELGYKVEEPPKPLSGINYIYMYMDGGKKTFTINRSDNQLSLKGDSTYKLIASVKWTEGEFV